jgi:hypothetical protein
MKPWARLAMTTLVALGLVVSLSLDADGDALTVDFPSAVLAITAGSDLTEDVEDPEGFHGEPVARVRTALVLAVHRACRRWMPASRRWQTSFLADPPV